ncbi:MAG: hypothetical protein J5J06_11845 [Phycisphaerae bacterium]|nr:hypothetical protein [Phycisphaerae bacterium]
MSPRRPKPTDAALAQELETMLEPKFPGIEVAVGKNPRWNRTSVTFTWAGFSGLLPEERFHRLMTVVPEEFREQRMEGFVWLELAPGETVEAFLKLPRSEDIVAREATTYAELVKTGFFDALSKALGPAPQVQCRGVFDHVGRILGDRGCAAHVVQEAKLVFIHHGAFCDCQALLTARKSLDDAHHGAA